MWKHHQSEPGYHRGWLKADLPENPICWLLGHFPKVVITEWKHLDPSLWIDCRVCGRRYSDPDQRRHIESQVARGASYREAAAALTARRVANARRLPAREFLADVHRRRGWLGAELALSHEAHWPTRTGKRRGYGRFSVKLHLGGRGSETPIDGHLLAGPFGYYWSVGGIGGRFAEWVGRGHKRDLALAVHGGRLWWKVWYDDDGGHDAHHRCDSWRKPKLWPWSAGRRKHRPWMCLRDGNIELNPVDALWGRPTPTRVSVGEPTVLAVVIDDFPGDHYLLDATLERWTWARDHGPAWARRVQSVDHHLDWRCSPGIPVRNHDWKGDEVLGSGVRFDELPEDWPEVAVDRIIEQIRRDRVRYGYVAPQAAS